MIKKTEPKMSKSAFVRAQPDSLSTKEVVAKGRAEGLVITEQNVWATRYAMKNGKRKAKTRAAAPVVSVKASNTRIVGKAAGSSSVTAAGSESQFLSLVLDLGLVRSQSLMSDVRRRLSGFALD